MVWLLYAITATFLWALTASFDKHLVEHAKLRSPILTIFNGIMGIIVLVLVPFIGLQSFSFQTIGIALVAGFLYLGFVFPYYKACQYEDISNIMIMWKTGPIFTLILAWIFLGEVLTIMDYLGFVLLLVGSVMASFSGTGKKKLWLSIAFWLLVLSAFIASIRAVLDRYLFSTFDIFSVYIWVRIGAFIMAIIMLAVYWKNAKKAVASLTTKQKGFVAGKSLLDLTGLFLIGFAFMIEKAAIVAVVVAALIPLIMLGLTVFYTRFIPRFITERIDKKTLRLKIAAMGVITLGLYFVYLA